MCNKDTMIYLDRMGRSSFLRSGTGLLNLIRPSPWLCGRWIDHRPVVYRDDPVFQAATTRAIQIYDRVVCTCRADQGLGDGLCLGPRHLRMAYMLVQLTPGILE